MTYCIMGAQQLVLTLPVRLGRNPRTEALWNHNFGNNLFNLEDDKRERD